jgi:DNA sulfur modification protein DndD
VEKNRIDNFSRIAAQVPAKQTELISTLFGLESFTEFVRNFTVEIDEKYIDLIGKKATELAKKRQELSGAEKQIETNTAELHAISTEEQQLAIKYQQGLTFSQMVFELDGSEEIPGAIRQLETELLQPKSAKNNLTTAAFEELSNNISINITQLEGKQQELTAASLQLSFKQLYEAISQVC